MPFAATVFKEGHDVIDAAVVLTAPSGRTVRRAMVQVNPGLGRWSAAVQVDEVGAWTWHVDAWLDDWGTWLHDAGIKIPAGIDVELMLEAGARLLERGAGEDGRPEDDARLLRDTAESLRDQGQDPATRWRIATEGRIGDVIAAGPITSLTTSGRTLTLRVERLRAGRGSWYEFFRGPRRGAARRRLVDLRHFRRAIACRRSPRWASTSSTSRRSIRSGREAQGAEQRPHAGPDDPGSPWAIGARRAATTPSIPNSARSRTSPPSSTRAKRARTRDRARHRAAGSPDHPWVKEHPEWFTTARRHHRVRREPAEEVPGHLSARTSTTTREGCRARCCAIFQFWIARGVRVFRVDNPHTKPVRFWEWLSGR